MNEPLISIPVSKIYCCVCKKEYSAKQLSYLFTDNAMGSYKAPFCPGCTQPISVERLRISRKYVKDALKKSAELFGRSGKDPAKNDIKFITIFYQGGVSGCAAIWPEGMAGIDRSLQFDSFINKKFGISSYLRDALPKEYPVTGVPFKYVYVAVSEGIKRTPIADFRLN